MTLYFSHKIKISQVISVLMMTYYILGAWVFFELIAQPALLREIDIRVGADSQTYIDTARYIAATGGFKLSDVVSLSFNYFGPVALLTLFDYNHLLIFFLNTIILFFSVWSLRRYYHFDMSYFMFWLIINPITLLSLVAINKEIMGLSGVIWLLIYVKSGRIGHLFLSILLAILTRWQQLAFIILFLPYIRLLRFDRRREFLLPTLMLFSASFVYPFIRTKIDFTGDIDALNVKNQFAQAGGIIPMLNKLQDSFLYWLAFFPKMLLNLIGNFPRVARVFDSKDSADFYNRMLVGHQIEILMLIIIGIFKKSFSLKYKETHMILLYCTIYCIGLTINYRYFYPLLPIFILLIISKKSILLNRNIKSSVSKNSLSVLKRV